MKKSRRFLALVLTVITLMSVMAVTAFAANNQNTYPTVSINTSTFSPGQVREKTDSSKIYYRGLVCADTHTFVQARGSYSNSTSASYINKTVANKLAVSYVICRKDVEYAITNLINEDGYNYARLYFKRLTTYTTSASTNLEYVWSPDSVGSGYTVAT